MLGFTIKEKRQRIDNQFFGVNLSGMDGTIQLQKRISVNILKRSP